MASLFQKEGKCPAPQLEVDTRREVRVIGNMRKKYWLELENFSHYSLLDVIQPD